MGIFQNSENAKTVRIQMLLVAWQCKSIPPCALMCDPAQRAQRYALLSPISMPRT